jgi:hypothetical protein
MVERHRFMMSLSWSTETTWSYSYTARSPGGCFGRPPEDGEMRAFGSGRDSWRLTQRRPTLWYVDFYTPAPAFLRGRPSTRLGNLHKVNIVRELTGSFIQTNKCGSTVRSETRWPTTDCGTRTFPAYALGGSDFLRRQHLRVGAGSGGNRAYRREIGLRNCPFPPGAGLTDWYPPRGLPELRGAQSVVLGYPGRFSVPFRWERLKDVSLKRLSIPLRYSKTIEYPPADTSDDQEKREFETQTGRITTKMTGMFTLKRIGPPRRFPG